MTPYQIIQELKRWKAERKGLPVSVEEVKERLPNLKDPEDVPEVYAVLHWKSDKGWISGVD